MTVMTRAQRRRCRHPIAVQAGTLDRCLNCGNLFEPERPRDPNLLDLIEQTPVPALPPPHHARFDGPAYEPPLDQARLSGQLLRIFELMRDGRWRTLPEIEVVTRDPAASISAQLRHLRKARWGSHTVNKRRRTVGLWEYQLIVTDQFVTRRDIKEDQ